MALLYIAILLMPLITERLERRQDNK